MPAAYHDALRRAVAARLGIADGYYDIGGTWHPTKPETLDHLTAAWGVPVDTQGAAADSLGRLIAQDRARWLPPTVVVTADSAGVAVPVRLPIDGPGARLAWTVELETGESVTGCTAVDTLVPAAASGGDRLETQLKLSDLPLGYHQLRLEMADRSASAHLIVAPPRAFAVDEVIGERRAWGVLTQLYGLRGAGDDGHGRLTQLDELSDRVGALGGAFVGVNPLHARFPADAGLVSPYNPSSRRFYDPLYADLYRLPELAGEVRPPASDAAIVDYPAVYTRYAADLARAFTRFSATADADRRADFAAFVEAGGEPLRRFALFHALHADRIAEGAPPDWRDWPAELRTPDDPRVAAFAETHGEAIDRHRFAQWVVDGQLMDSAAHARGTGLALGLYADLAVGVAPWCADAWADPALFVPNLSIGAPPDPFSPTGQVWGLSPYHPETLAQTGYAAFVATIRAAMRPAGVVRIDHVLGLVRQFWVPDGATAEHGTYVAQPFEAMLRIIALESVRNRCCVVGEDLGTVPDGLRDAMAAVGMLGCCVLPFERVGGDALFARASTYRKAAVVSASTHDLPTVRGFWEGRDIDWREGLGLFPDPGQAEAERATRRADKVKLLAALKDAGLWQGDPEADATLPFGPGLLVQIHRFLARTPSRLLAVQLEDLAGDAEQANLPGTLHGHPSWRRRPTRPIEAVFDDPTVHLLLKAVAVDRADPAVTV